MNCCSDRRHVSIARSSYLYTLLYIRLENNKFTGDSFSPFTMPAIAAHIHKLSCFYAMHGFATHLSVSGS